MDIWFKKKKTREAENILKPSINNLQKAPVMKMLQQKPPIFPARIRLADLAPR